MAEALPRVTAVVLAYLSEPWLVRCVESLLASEKAAVDVVLVDNGCTNDDVTRLSAFTGVTVLRPSENLGFAGGCNAGAEVATGEYIALVNGDAVVEPSTIATLVAEAAQPGVGIAGASIRLAENPNLLNAGGNPVHVLGLSWAGRLGQPEYLTEPVDVAVASGACLVLRREHWQRLGGFDEKYFAYHEDAELSLRTWRLGLRVVYVPDAIAIHRYEFSRNARKYYLIERNRLMFLATIWSRRTLLLLAPALLALEVAMLLLALKQGWTREKLRGWRWLWQHRGHLRSRRAKLQGERLVSERQWMTVLTPKLDPTAALGPMAVIKPLNAVVSAYWGMVKRLI